jgi:PGF-pre-PGF domain-containing protein
MSERRTTPSNRCFTLVVVLLATLLVLPGAAAADPDVSVEQGDACYEVTPLGDGTESVEQYYDYRVHGEEYSSHGTTDIQESQTSQLYVYNGSDGLSVVFLHDRLGDESGGGTVSMDLSGLPSDGSWAVEDDDYSGQNDSFDHGGTTSEIDWVWRDNRTDGAAFRGLTSDEFDAVTVDARFGENADRNWEYAGDGPTTWQVRSGDGSTQELAMDQSVTVQRGTCDSTAPSAAINATPSAAESGETVTLDASNSSDDGSIEEYRWDFNGNGSVDATTTEPTTTHAYASEGSYDATVTVVDAGLNEDTAQTTVTVDDPSGIDDCTTIDQSGSYTLTGDVGGDAATCIEITASDVTLDGGGHAVSGSGSSDTVGVAVATGGGSNVTVRHLTVADWGTGIDVDGTDGATLRGVTATQNDVGIRVAGGSQDATVADSSASGNGWAYVAEGYDGSANADVTALELESATVSFTGGTNVGLRAETSPQSAPDGMVAVDSYVAVTGTGPDPALSLTMAYTDAAAEGVDESTLRLHRHAGDAWTRVADPNGVDPDGNRVTAEDVALSDGSDVVFAPLGNESTADDGNDGSDDGNDGSNGGSTGGAPSGGSSGSSGGGGGDSGDESLDRASEPVAAATAQANDTYAIDLRNVPAGRMVESRLPGLSVFEGENVRMDGVGIRPAREIDQATAELVFTREHPDDDAVEQTDAELAYVELRWRERSYAVSQLQLRFTVSKSAYERRGSAREHVALYERRGGDWQAVDTRVVDEGDAAVTYEATTDGVGPFVVGLEHPEIAVADVAVNRTELVAGDAVAVTATFENTGSIDGTHTARLVHAGETVATRDVTVASGETATVTFDRRLREPGPTRVGVDGRTARVTVQEPEPVFEVQSVAVDSSTVERGDQVTIEVTVANTGRADGTYTADLRLFDSVVASQDVDVPAGETRTLTFTRSIEAPGEHTATVGNASAQFTVEGEDATATGTDDAVQGSGPGFGAGLAVVAVLFAVGGRLLRGRTDR